MSRPSDLPEFAAVLDAHAVALARRLGEEDDVAEASGVASLDGEPLARHWLEGLAMLWKGNLAKAPPTSRRTSPPWARSCGGSRR
jgi:hypothetical protein